MSEYEEKRKKEADIARRIVLADVKAWIESLPDAERKKPVIVVGTKTFTPEQLAKEVDDDTEYGRQFAAMMQKSRLEMAKRRE